MYVRKKKLSHFDHRVRHIRGGCTNNTPQDLPETLVVRFDLLICRDVFSPTTEQVTIIHLCLKEQDTFIGGGFASV